MMTNYRKATLEDLEQVLEAVEDSRLVLKEQGNGQWQDGYPNRDDFINDINNGRLFVTYNDDPKEIVGVCALTYREEDYHHLYEGEWLTNLPYMVMHRVAIKKKFKDQGLGKKLFEVFIEQAKLEGYRSLRIDTHEGNAIMRHLIESFGFQYCGKAILTPNKDRMVFEKVLELNPLIGHCGLDCEKCNARAATIKNDDNLRKEIAKKWSELNNVEITPEQINCDGCRLNGRKTIFCDKLCPIRQCVLAKRIDTCSGCAELNTCEKIKMITGNNVEAKERLTKNRLK